MNPNDLSAYVYNQVAQDAANGATASGEIANWLIAAGYTVGTISNLLNGVATSGSATPAQILYAQQEMAYLQQYQQPKTNWLPLLAVAAGLYFISRK